MQTDLSGRDLIGELDFSKEEVETVMDVAFDLKRKRALGEPHAYLRDKVLAMLFFFSSTRTRGSFEAGMAQLGGHAAFIESKTTQIAHGDTPKEIGEIFGRYFDGIAIRHVDWGVGNGYLNAVPAASRVPVLNRQCDIYHPFQILADLMTIIEKKGRDLRRKKMVVSWFKDDVFHEAVSHNLILLLAVPIMVISSILIAVVLYERVTGWRMYRSVLFIPYILAVPVIGVVFSNLLQLNGIINETLRYFGLGGFGLDWIGNPRLTLWSVMGVIIWREVGFGIVLFLARLLSINEELIDAGKVDGANWWQRLWYVIIPQLRSVIEFYVVISVITMLAWVFSYIYTISRGGPGTATQIMELYIFNYAFRNLLRLRNFHQHGCNLFNTAQEPLEREA